MPLILTGGRERRNGAVTWLPVTRASPSPPWGPARCSACDGPFHLAEVRPQSNPEFMRECHRPAQIIWPHVNVASPFSEIRKITLTELQRGRTSVLRADNKGQRTLVRIG